MHSIHPRALFAGLLALPLVACDSQPGSNATDDDPLSFRPQSMEATEIVEAPITGINLGWGWNSFDARPVPSICIEFDERQEPAQARQMSMHEVADSYELMQRLGMSAEASVKTIGVEVSGKAKFAKETNITGFSSNFVLNASVDNGVRYTAPAKSENQAKNGAIRLTATAVRLADSNLDEFKHQCGNAFVSAVYSGAKLSAVLTVAKKAQGAQESLSAELSGSGWGARMKTTLGKVETSNTNSDRLDLSIFQIGGRGDSIPASKKDLIKKLDTLSALAFDAPKDFRIAVTPYESLSNWPAKGIGGEEREFDELASYWGAYNTLYDEIQQVLDKPADFKTAGLKPDKCVDLIAVGTDELSLLKTAQDEILTGLMTMQKLALKCNKKPGKCEFKAEDYRNPYAFRAMLPVPDGAVDKLEDIGAYTIADTAKRRCAIDFQNSGCLSNSEIDTWSEKIGLRPLRLPDEASLNQVHAALASAKSNCPTAPKKITSVELKNVPHPLSGAHPLFRHLPDMTVSESVTTLVPRSDANTSSSPETGHYPVLWYHPGIEPDVYRALNTLKPGLAEIVGVSSVAR